MGKRVGRKRSDRRWQTQGVIWDSKFEYEVYDTLKADGHNVRKATKSDAISYCEPKARVRCLSCGSRECGQDRIYTPDLFFVPEGFSEEFGYYIEVKGYFNAQKRALFRCLRTARQDTDIRVILATNSWVSKGKTKLTTFTNVAGDEVPGYFQRYLKDTPVAVWEGALPEGWA